MSTNKLLAEVKSVEQDFEWYPTTDEIINTIQLHLKKLYGDKAPSVLDCGAGDGRVLQKLNTSAMYAIEKSKPLLNSLDRKIFVVGTEFKEQTLIDKEVDVVFSNPPYSEFEEWAIKIISEAKANHIFLVIPTRWKSSQRIKDALEAREAESEVIAQNDFITADRMARAKVDVIKITLCNDRGWGHKSQNVDPFRLWFEDNFKIEIGKEAEEKNKQSSKTKKQEIKDSLQNALVSGDNIVPVLEQLYQKELGNLVNTYKQLETVDGHLLHELGVNLEGLREALKMKVDGLKDRYWHELFDNLKKVTNKLTGKSREQLLSTLTKYAHVDFTCSNAYAIVIWVIKNANQYYDDQLVNLVERMTERACVTSYVSNRKTFGEDGWNYRWCPGGKEQPIADLKIVSRYKLEHRCVLDRVGGVSVSDWDHERTAYAGLTQRAFNLIEDIRTVAGNMGFDVEGHETARSFDWQAGKSYTFRFTNYKTEQVEILMEVKAFKKGTLHIKFHPEFMCKLNVEFGRLKGWVKSKQQASEELEVPIEKMEEYYGCNLQLEGSNLMRLEVQKAA